MKVENMISGLRSHSFQDRLIELGLESLAERRHKADMVMMHKIVHKVGDLSVDQWFDTYDGRRVTRAGAARLMSGDGQAIWSSGEGFSVI
jgi:hypothetical protein